MEKISLILPVYNVRNRLETCLQSLLIQRTNSKFDYNIILVDDGSDDGSARICDVYSKKYPIKISVVHKKNEGVSSARNYGIEHTDSEYIGFIDPDDYVNNHYLIDLFNALKKANADFASCGFYEKWDRELPALTCNQDYVALEGFQILNTNDALRKLFYQDDLEFAVWGKLFRRELFRDVKFPVSKRFEDVPVTYNLISRSRKVAIIRNKNYIYWQRKNGMLNSNFNSDKLDIIPVMDSLYDSVLKNYPELKSAVSSRYFAGLCNVYFQTPSNIKAKSILWKKMLKVRRNVLLNKEAPLKTRLGALSTYFGQRLAKIAYRKTQNRGRKIKKSH